MTWCGTSASFDLLALDYTPSPLPPHVTWLTSLFWTAQAPLLPPNHSLTLSAFTCPGGPPRPVIFSVINLGQGRVRAAEDGTEYPSLAQVIRAMRVGGVSVEGGARIRPRFPLPTSWFHRSAAWEICVMKRVQPRDLLQHSWYWDGPKERGDTAVSAGRPGDFIVRPSSDGTKFVVACKPFGEGSANLVRLQIKVVDQSTYTFGEKSAPTLSEIIQIMRSCESGRNPALFLCSGDGLTLAASDTLPNPAKGQPKSSQIKLRQPVKGAVLHRSAFRAIIRE